MLSPRWLGDNRSGGRNEGSHFRSNGLPGLVLTEIRCRACDLNRVGSRGKGGQSEGECQGENDARQSWDKGLSPVNHVLIRRGWVIFGAVTAGQAGAGAYGQRQR